MAGAADLWGTATNENPSSTHWKNVTDPTTHGTGNARLFGAGYDAGSAGKPFKNPIPDQPNDAQPSGGNGDGGDNKELATKDDRAQHAQGINDRLDSMQASFANSGQAAGPGGVQSRTGAFAQGHSGGPRASGTHKPPGVLQQVSAHSAEVQGRMSDSHAALQAGKERSKAQFQARQSASANGGVTQTGTGNGMGGTTSEASMGGVFDWLPDAASVRYRPVGQNVPEHPLQGRTVVDADRLLPTADPLVMQRHGKLYTERSCKGCGEPAWLRKEQRFCSVSCGALSQTLRGENHPHWAGGDISYRGLHNRVTRERGKAPGCYNRQLGLRDCTSTNYSWALLHGNDPLDPLSYISLCQSCHSRYDYKGGKAGVPRPSIQGSKHVNAQLSDDDIREIRQADSPGTTDSGHPCLSGRPRHRTAPGWPPTPCPGCTGCCHPTPSIQRGRLLRRALVPGLRLTY